MRGREPDHSIGTFALSRALKLAKRPESTMTGTFRLLGAWCGHISAPSVAATGYGGQARVTGHEAMRGHEPDRSIGAFALSRAKAASDLKW